MPVRAVGAAMLVSILVSILAACGAAGIGDGPASSPGPNGPQTSEADMILEGTIRLDGAATPIEVAALRITLRDVSRADASAPVVAEAELRSQTMDATAAVGFRLAVPADLDPGASYELAAHADVDGSGDVTVGDYLTMTSNPVTVTGSQPPVDLVLRRVES